MKHTSFLFLIAIVFMACKNDVKTVEEVASQVKINSELPIKDKPRQEIKKEVEKDIDSVNVAKFKFEESFHNFNDVPQGETVYHTFKFTNVGKVPLVISNAKSTCGCTVPTYPKKPIPVGEGGELKVKFNTTGKKGVNNKPIYITANTFPVKTTLKITANVLVPEKEEEEKKEEGK